ncbi:MAG: HDIG domain-containing protein [Paludibacteraceae bacterium]|nr:HDIG domain-containing protein [Paludibacteraceae bacterium]
MNRYSNILKALAFCLLAALTVYLFPRYSRTFRYSWEVGKPWPYATLTADFDFPIFKTEAQLEQERSAILRESLSPCFTLLSDTTPRALVLSLQDRERLNHYGCRTVSVVEGRVSKTYPISRFYTPRTAYETFGLDMEPNLLYDSLTTAQLRESLLAQISVTEGMVQAGEKIIERGEVVSEQDSQILRSLSRAYDDETLPRNRQIRTVIGDAVLVLVFLLMFFLYLRVFRPKHLQDLRSVLFFCLLVALTVIMASLVLRFTVLSIYLVPFAWVPILTRVFYDSRTALFLHLTTIFITSLAVPAPFEFLMVQTAVGMVAVASLQDLTKRAQLVQTAGWILLTYIVAYTAFMLATTGDWHDLQPYTYLYFLVNVVLIICSYGLIYLFEKVFRLVSSVTLVELADINSDWMHEFAEKAPGTFQHSMQVSNLATEAAKQIGANPLLIRTGALYHDIGKMAHPEYFTENQQDGHNPLSEMEPEQAAQIVISHVTEGARMAEKHGLPEVITQFILTHHGTSLTRYFYNTWINRHPGEAVSPSLFRYPGPKPSTREGAILMMADAIEARSHSLSDFTEDNITQLVNDMIDQQVADGQFAETPLSFKDLEDIRHVFTARLIAINHRRIRYPEIRKS